MPDAAVLCRHAGQGAWPPIAVEHLLILADTRFDPATTARTVPARSVYEIAAGRAPTVHQPMTATLTATAADCRERRRLGEDHHQHRRRPADVARQLDGSYKRRIASRATRPGAKTVGQGEAKSEAMTSMYRSVRMRRFETGTPRRPAHNTARATGRRT